MALYYDEILAGNCFGQINVAPTPTPTNVSPTSPIVKNEKKELNLSDEFGFSIEELFYMARQFLKENANIQLKYADNIRSIALLKQIKFGKWNASYTQDVGFLDVVGNDRKQAWISLGDMSKEKAMEEYIQLLLNRCSLFRIDLENKHKQNEENDQLRKDDETRRTLELEAERVRQYELEQVSRIEKQQKKREDFQRKQIQDVLNQQTYSQFKAYAEQQYPNNRQAQEKFIRQLQEQHFQQYMEQVYQQQLIDQQQQLGIKPNMEQQQQPQIENVVPPAMPLNIVVPPTVPTNIIIAPPPTNTVPPINTVPFVPTVPLPSVPQMPPLGPAPAQLPPLVHPPPSPSVPPSTIPLQSVTNTNTTIPETKLDSTIPIQTQIETLSLTTPLEPIAPPPMVNDATQINNQLQPTQESTDGNAVATPPNDPNADGQASLPLEEGKTEVPNIIPANMWTRKDIKEFKEQIRKEKDAVIKISSGETVTVRVPTHEDGQCIFWEFSTDYYDLGFGVYFEWSKAQSNTVTVHVSDSSDEEEENEDGSNPEKKDIEKGSGSTNKPPKPRQDEIVPIYRRDCHEEVYAGSHPYPGHGVYLLKFDNSYSLWRSKTLYYRVYYSK